MSAFVIFITKKRLSWGDFAVVLVSADLLKDGHWFAAAATVLIGWFGLAVMAAAVRS